jgi:hypothetical protein
MVTSLGWSDPRTEIGEVTDPERFPKEAIESLKLSLGYRFAAQANQEPSNPEGSAIKRDWYPIVDVFDPKDVEKLTLSYDVGFSSSPTADWTWGSWKAKLRDGNALGLHELTLFQHFGKWDSPDRDQKCSQFGSRCKAVVDAGFFPSLKGWTVTVEAGIGGSVDVVREFKDALVKAGLPAKSMPSNVNKVVRSNGYVAAVQAKKVGLYQGVQLAQLGFRDGAKEWIAPYFGIVCSLVYDNAPDGTPRFKGEHDDPLDSEVMAHDQLTPKTSWSSFNPVIKSKPKTDAIT